MSEGAREHGWLASGWVRGRVVVVLRLRDQLHASLAHFGTSPIYFVGAVDAVAFGAVDVGSGSSNGVHSCTL